jgi:hypothetical protein
MRSAAQASAGSRCAKVEEGMGSGLKYRMALIDRRMTGEVTTRAVPSSNRRSSSSCSENHSTCRQR